VTLYRLLRRLAIRPKRTINDNGAGPVELMTVHQVRKDLQ
jgi:hypothetical protein